VRRARLVAVGKIGRPHGVGGELRLDPGGHLPRGLEGYTRFYLGNPGGSRAAPVEPEPVEIERSKAHGRLLLVKFAGVESPEAAARFVNGTLYVERQEMPPLEAGEYYHADLLGCRVATVEGASLGEVADVFATAAHDVLVIRGADGEWMLPMAGEYMVGMDLEAGEIRVRLPEGGP
jgi:16S rRNA processing protein RimM